jgi:hypothetical protein
MYLFQRPMERHFPSHGLPDSRDVGETGSSLRRFTEYTLKPGIRDRIAWCWADKPLSKPDNRVVILEYAHSTRLAELTVSGQTGVDLL